MREGLEKTFTAQEREGDPMKTAWRGKCLEPECDMCFTFDELQLLQVSASLPPSLLVWHIRAHVTEGRHQPQLNVHSNASATCARLSFAAAWD